MEDIHYNSIDEYRDAADALYSVGGVILFSFARHDCDTKNIIIRNFVARTAITLKSIFALWDIEDYQSTWIIHRALVDRMFHLRSIGDTNSFESFDDWSFFEQYKAQNRVKSDDEFKHQAFGWVYNLDAEMKKRVKRLSENKPVWRRPKAKTVAKDMEMEFLYKYGYDYASTHVHPMASDGQQDFYTITKLEPSPKFPSQISVISNTILTSSMIIQDAMNYSSFKWRKVLWDFLDEVRLFLDKGDTSYQISFLKLANMAKNGGLCEPNRA